MEEVESAGLSHRALRAIALIGLALVGLAAGVGVYLWSTSPHPYDGPPPPSTSQPIPVSMAWRSSTLGWLMVHDAGGPESLLFRTADGGAHWQRQVSVDGPSSVRFTDARHGTVRIDPFSGGLQVLRTDDAGAHWLTVALPDLVPGSVSTPVFLNGSAGWLLAQQPGPAGLRSSFYETEDAGRHWRALPDLPNDLADLAFATAGTGWLTGATAVEPALLVTRDGGQHWTPQALPAGGPRQGDGLEIAPPVLSPDGRGVLPVYDRDANQGWVFETSDGGRTWLDPRPLPWTGAQPVFADGAAGWTWNGGSASVTADSGRSWQPAGALSGGWAFNAITPVSASVAWASALSSTAQGSVHLVTWSLFRTADGGRHWTQVRLPNLT